MQRFQNTYTRRFNKRYRLWGPCLPVALQGAGGGERSSDGTGLSERAPVLRASQSGSSGSLRSGKGQRVAGFFWGSFAQGCAVVGRRHRPWMETEVRFEQTGFADTPLHRRARL
jgi:hypothetical protein